MNSTGGGSSSNNNSPSLRRRNNSSSNRGGGTHRMGVLPITRPPILLSFTSLSTSSSCHDLKTNVAIEAGHVGQPRWKHVIELASLASLSTTAIISDEDEYDERKTAVDTTTADSYFRIYANTMEHVFHLLGQDSKDRRVVILHPGLYVQRYWKMAITRILQDIIGTPAVTFQSAITMVPFAIPPTPHNNTLLLVHITLQEAQCMIFADKLVLEYTYQACGYPKSVNRNSNNKKLVAPPSLLDAKKMQEAWIKDNEQEYDDETTSLIFLILKTLEACPIQLRLYAIHSMVFSGNIIDPLFSLMIAKKLEGALKSDDATTTTSSKESKVVDTKTGQDENQPQQQPKRWSYVPLDKKLLRPLADHISVVQFTPRQIRPDLLPWIGASAWSNYWHEQDPDSSQVHWQSLSPIPLAQTKQTGASSSTDQQ